MVLVQPYNIRYIYFRYALAYYTHYFTFNEIDKDSDKFEA